MAEEVCALKAKVTKVELDMGPGFGDGEQVCFSGVTNSW